MLGVIAAQTGEPQKAVTLIDKALRIDPEHAGALCNKGTALRALGQARAALQSYERALSLRPDHAIAHLNRGNILGGLGQLEEALASYDRAIGLQEAIPEAHLARGNTLMTLGRVEGAVTAFSRALLHRENLQARLGRAQSLKELGRYEESLGDYERAIAAGADQAEYHHNCGFLLKELGRLDEAISSYDRAVAINNDFAEARCNRAHALLLSGDFAGGWADYDWRLRCAPFAPPARPDLPQPPWLGSESLDRKTILVHHEQGLGDTIQFCRYVKSLAERGASVVLEVQDSLRDLLTGLPGTMQVITRGELREHCDYRCPLPSLPRALDTRLHSIPAAHAYLRADPIKVASWQERLGERRTRVGLVWRGSARHVNDRNRSMSLELIAGHLPTGVEYVSLQKDFPESDAHVLRAHPGIRLFTDELHDFTDTAALCECLDLVISVDTSVAHLSGALGKETWLLLPSNPDWRWLLNRDDSPWYPSLRLFRQSRSGDWTTPLAKLQCALRSRSH